MGIKTSLHAFDKDAENPLKNLPTTWGLRPIRLIIIAAFACISEKPPHHMGIKTYKDNFELYELVSEKPPHHMGIKTPMNPTRFHRLIHSEKPPHHMGIKTTFADINNDST